MVNVKQSDKSKAQGQYRTTQTNYNKLSSYIKYRYDRAVNYLPKNANVYELGTGIGVGLSHLAKVRPDLDFVGFEISLDAIAYGNSYFSDIENLQLVHTPNIESVYQNIKPNSFLIAYEVLEHLNDEMLEFFKRKVMSNVNEAVFSFPYNQQNIEGTDHLQSFTIHDVFEIFPGFETIFMRKGSLKFMGHWVRQERTEIVSKLGIGGEDKAILRYSNYTL
jgi:Putative methyltransferase